MIDLITKRRGISIIIRRDIMRHQHTHIQTHGTIKPTKVIPRNRFTSNHTINRIQLGPLLLEKSQYTSTDRRNTVKVRSSRVPLSRFSEPMTLFETHTLHRMNPRHINLVRLMLLVTRHQMNSITRPTPAQNMSMIMTLNNESLMLVIPRSRRHMKLRTSYSIKRFLHLTLANTINHKVLKDTTRISYDRSHRTL